MSKKIKSLLSLLLVVVMTAGIAISGTVAYLQHQDSDVNVMTLGNVKIEQLEYERVVENGAWVSVGETDRYGYTPDEIQEFTQAKPLYPAVFADGIIKWDDRNGSQNASGAGSHQQSWGQVGASGSNQLFDDSVKNVQDKFVFVKNTGKSDAYVRTFIALEQGGIEADEFENVIMTNTNINHWEKETVATDVEIDGSKYVVLCLTYLGPKSNPTGILAPGAVSYPSFLQVYMKPEATNEDVEAIDGNGNGTYDILVLSQAVQTAGFDNAKDALDKAFGDPADNDDDDTPLCAGWFSEVDIPKFVVTSDELVNIVLKNGKYVIGNDITAKSYTYAFDNNVNVSVDLNGYTIKVDHDASDPMQNTAFIAMNGGSIEFNGNGILDMNYKAENPKEYCTPFWVSNNGTVTVNGGEYLLGNCKQKYHIYVQNSGKVIINDGKFITSDPDAAIAYCINGFIEINGGFFQNTANANKALLDMGNNKNYINNQKITLRGGTFVNWNPMDSAFARPWSDIPALIVLADGYEMVSETQANGDVWYTVVEK